VKSKVTLTGVRTEVKQESQAGPSKVKLVLGAASLFFFLVGLKRSFRKEDGSEIFGDGDQPSPPNERPEAAPRRSRTRKAG
jgi:hypothetical protein